MFSVTWWRWSRRAVQTRLTVMVAVAVGPPRPRRRAVVDSWTVKLPEVSELAVGVNLSPAAPCAT